MCRPVWAACGSLYLEGALPSNPVVTFSIGDVFEIENGLIWVRERSESRCSLALCVGLLKPGMSMSLERSRWLPKYGE
jgi:hypothetical protein